MSASRASGNASANAKPFACSRPDCNQTFARKKHKTDHEQAVHNEEAQHPCEVKGCKKQYRYRSDLVRHQHEKHCQDPKTYQCNICSLLYTRGSTLKDHITKKHKRWHSEPTKRLFSNRDPENGIDKRVEADQDILTDLHIGLNVSSVSAFRSPGCKIAEGSAVRRKSSSRDADASKESNSGQSNETELRRELKTANQKISKLTEEVEDLRQRIIPSSASSHDAVSADASARNSNNRCRQSLAVRGSDVPQHSDPGSVLEFGWNDGDFLDWDLPPAPQHSSIELWELSDRFQAPQPGAMQERGDDPSTYRARRLQQDMTGYIPEIDTLD